MTESVKKRPTAVTVIAWFCIIVGCWGTIVTACQVWNGPPPAPADSDEQFGFGRLNYPLMLWMKDFQSVCSIVELIAGVCLLKLHAWARAAIEVVSWLEILIQYILPVIGAVWTICYYPRVRHMLADLSAWSVTITFGLFIFQLAMGAAVNGAIIYYLRSKKVREAVG